MDPRNVRSWLIGTLIMSMMTIIVSVTIRSKLSGLAGIENTFIWTATSVLGIVVQITIVSIALFLIIAIIDAL